MLQKQTVAPTFSLLTQLMELDVLSTYNLVSETGLSLLMGHRISNDLDMFLFKKFKNEILILELMDVLKKNLF